MLTTTSAALLTLGPGWLDPNSLLHQLGGWALWGAALVVFAECGVFTFFMPGDALLFTVGLFVGTGGIRQPLWLVCAVLTVAAVAGNLVGYEIGRAVGPRLFGNPDARFLKQEYADQTVAFFDKYGPRAIVLARFVPIVRTFITVTAGVGRMHRRRFLGYTAVGALLWACGVTLLGYWLGRVAFVRAHIDSILIGIVLMSVPPMVVEYLRSRRLDHTERTERTDGPARTERTGRTGSGVLPGQE